MKYKVETLPSYRIAYMRQIGPYGPSNALTMEKLKQWAKENHLLTGSAIILGIPQDNPETTLPEACRYDACIVISNDYEADHSVAVTELSGGPYVVFQIEHTAEDIQKAWIDIFSTLQKSGYQIDHKPILERYTGAMVHNEFCEICVPIIAAH
ncbi:AraC family transcriptional regulator [Paenibacillus sp. OAS669]|uniref:AraC family transcriptional regulator n=1 Tax=Paenibacillus sp. OAS669 TaxID=2663821 RepID=UPI00178BF526|nr:GyrI-like domain-containing protein [Paenibacillus sp. OAS669]MBE1441390.1 DNA gyrase inhibitor GyrI [Paenibacillus sp. OAS669]